MTLLPFAFFYSYLLHPTQHLHALACSLGQGFAKTSEGRTRGRRQDQGYAGVWGLMCRVFQWFTPYLHRKAFLANRALLGHLPWGLTCHQMMMDLQSKWQQMPCPLPINGLRVLKMWPPQSEGHCGCQVCSSMSVQLGNTFTLFNFKDWGLKFFFEKQIGISPCPARSVPT